MDYTLETQYHNRGQVQILNDSLFVNVVTTKN